MNFKTIIEEDNCNIPSGKLGIKNKGSLVKFDDFYINFYNILLEKHSIKCDETRYRHFDKEPGVRAVDVNWQAFKVLDDNFTRLKFNMGMTAYRIEKERLMGIFTIKFTLEFDYKRKWRDNKLLNYLLPYYIKYIYKDRIFSWIDYYTSYLNNIKDDLRTAMNMDIFD